MQVPKPKALAALLLNSWDLGQLTLCLIPPEIWISARSSNSTYTCLEDVGKVSSTAHSLLIIVVAAKVPIPLVLVPWDPEKLYGSHNSMKAAKSTVSPSTNHTCP